MESTVEAAPVFSPPAQVAEPKLKFELTLRLDDPADLRVQEGDRVTKGQILAERRPNEQQMYGRSRLQAQLTSPRPVGVSSQLAAAKGELAAAQFRLKSLADNNPYVDPRMSSSYVQKEIELKALMIEKQAAIQSLQAQIQVEKQQAEQERRQVVDQLRVMDAAELERLKLRSPYTGKIRRLKVERGTNNEVVAKLKIVGES
jgi:biotin carboxyl carrier protein